MASRRALVITKPGSIALQDAPELVPGPGEVVAWPVHTGICIEAAGTAGAVERALSLARRGGRVVLVGLAGHDVTAAFRIDDAVNNDLLISASFAYTSAAFAEGTRCSATASSGRAR